MLVLSRNAEETIRIGDNITIAVIRISNGKVRIGITAPPEVTILRGELKNAITSAIKTAS